MADAGPRGLTVADIDAIADRVVEKLTEKNVVRFNKLRPQPYDNSGSYINSAVTEAETSSYLVQEDLIQTPTKTRNRPLG
jgi:hypothetical protein